MTTRKSTKNPTASASTAPARKDRAKARKKTGPSGGPQELSSPPPSDPTLGADVLAELAESKKIADKTTTSLSVRLTEKEKALITEAANIRGDSPTRFIKSSALTQAAHIRNTRKKTTFDFEAVAQRVGELLYKHNEPEYLIGYSSTLPDTQDGGPFNLDRVAWTKETWFPSDDPFDEEIWNKPEEFVDGHLFEFANAPILRNSQHPLSADDLVELSNAIMFGGTEFLARILALAPAGIRESASAIEEPVDPRLFK